MEYRPLGQSGLMLSPLTLGSMEFGSKVTGEEAGRLLARALERGINSFDTANCYAGGRSEEILAPLIAPHRGKIILATKFSVPMDGSDPNSGGTSRRNVVAACEASLKRLKTDYIDLFYIHRPFTQTGLDETLRGLEDLLRAGKVRAIGTSAFAGWQLVEAHWCARALHLTPPVTEQVAYSLLDRRAERELVPAAQTHGMGLTIWSPLVGGLLTGKYLSGAPNGARLQADDAAWGAKHFTPEAQRVTAKLAALATEAGLSLTAMSLAWTLTRPAVTSLVLGPRDLAQFDGQLAALDVTLSPDLLAEIDRIVPPGGVTVPYYLDDSWADFRPIPHRW